jgi:hypothetical protein
MKLTMSLLPLLLLSAAAQAQSDYPSGIYCSCPPTFSNTGGSVMPAVADKNFVTGILVRISWATLEPRDDQFNWTALDNQFSQAKAFNKKVALGVINGGGAPSWLYQQGVEPFPYLFRGAPDTLPIPWDAGHVAEWTELIAALGNRYRNDPALALVHVTHSTYNGFEMQLPFTPTDVANWQARGYSHARVINSWQRVIDSFRDAFPSAPLDVDVHPVLQSDSVSQGVAAYGYKNVGKRFGVFAAWWSQQNTTVYPGQYSLLLAAVDSSFSAVQMVANGTQDSARFGAGGLPAALDLAVKDGVGYWEVWNQDLLNPKFESMFLKLAGLTTSVESDLAGPPEGFALAQNFPNPFNPSTVISFQLPVNSHVTLKVFDVNGREVATLVDGEMAAGNHAVAFAPHRSAGGLYFYKITAGKFSQTRKAVFMK